MNGKSFRNTSKAKVGTMNNVGRLGMTQAVSTFGVGSIYEMRSSSGGASMILHSVMVGGLDHWPNDPSSEIRELSLEKVLKVRYFRRPPIEEQQGTAMGLRAIPAVRFPRAYYCDQCGTVGRVGKQFNDENFGGVRCGKGNCRGKGVPFRFVVACHDKLSPEQPGHIQDFPYEWWAHGRGVSCEDPAVKLTGSDEKSGLEGMVLQCKCGKAQSLAGIFSDTALQGLHCDGDRPWLGDWEKGCKRKLRVMQRGASNVYFPVTASAISIPPYSTRLLQLLGEVIGDALLENLRQGVPSAIQFLSQAARNIPGLDDPSVFSDQQITDGLHILAGMTPVDTLKSEVEQKRLERNAVVAGQLDEDDGELFAVPAEIPRSGGILYRFCQHLILVHRLREVRALRGFQRVDPTFEGDPYQIVCAPISIKSQPWLPAIEVRGEGIYLELDDELVSAWEESSPVVRRMQMVQDNYLHACANAGRTPGIVPSARFILAHTLSHLLMKQLSLECGYSGSSLRERLYVLETATGERCTGFLIYTASTSADGTLGGLVSQGEPVSFEGMLRSAVASARWCSSDPLCIESSGQGVDALNLAACHACALIAETSCERRNMFLDRGMVVGTLDCPESGFFHAILNSLG